MELKRKYSDHFIQGKYFTSSEWARLWGSIDELAETAINALTDEVVKIAEGMTEEVHGDQEMNINIKKHAKNKALTDLIATLKATKIINE